MKRFEWFEQGPPSDPFNPPVAAHASGVRRRPQSPAAVTYWTGRLESDANAARAADALLKVREEGRRGGRSGEAETSLIA